MAVSKHKVHELESKAAQFDQVKILKSELVIKLTICRPRWPIPEFAPQHAPVGLNSRVERGKGDVGPHPHPPMGLPHTNGTPPHPRSELRREERPSISVALRPAIYGRKFEPSSGPRSMEAGQ